MSEIFAQYGLFLAKTITFVLAVGVIVALIATAAQRRRRDSEGEIQVRSLNEHFEDMQHALEDAVFDEFKLKQITKEEKIELVIQVNGKLRGKFEIKADASDEEIKAIALADPSALKFIQDKTIKKVIVVKEEWTNANQLLTPTLKMKRTALSEKYEAALEGLINNADPVSWE